MQGTFGESQGTVARVYIGQVIMSICTKLQNKEHVIEALCKAQVPWSPEDAHLQEVEIY